MRGREIGCGWLQRPVSTAGGIFLRQVGGYREQGMHQSKESLTQFFGGVRPPVASLVGFILLFFVPILSDSHPVLCIIIQHYYHRVLLLLIAHISHLCYFQFQIPELEIKLRTRCFTLWVLELRTNTHMNVKRIIIRQ